MDEEEASRLLGGAGVDFHGGEVREVVERTEGWPVGLYVAALAVNTVSAKLKCATVTANTDGPTALTLLQLRPKSTVTDNGTTVATVPASGTATVNLATGTSSLQVCSASTS